MTQECCENCNPLNQIEIYTKSKTVGVLKCYELAAIYRINVFFISYSVVQKYGRLSAGNKNVSELDNLCAGFEGKQNYFLDLSSRAHKLRSLDALG